MWGPCDSLHTRASGQRSQPTWWHTYLSKGGHPTFHHRGARTQSFTPWWSPSFYLDHKPCQASSAKGGRRGEHDHGGERAPIQGSFGYIWACIRELHSKEVGACGSSHTFAHQTGRFPQVRGHVITGECRWWCWNGGNLPGGNTHYFFPYRWSPRAQQWCPSPRCSSSLGRGQQGSRRPASNRVFHWCPLAEVSFRLWHGPSIPRLRSLIKEAKAICAHSIQEAENCCSVAIREAEVQRASQVVSIQQSWHKAVQHLEEESIEEEKVNSTSSLSARLLYGLALQNSKACW